MPNTPSEPISCIHRNKTIHISVFPPPPLLNSSSEIWISTKYRVYNVPFHSLGILLRENIKIKNLFILDLKQMRDNWFTVSVWNRDIYELLHLQHKCHVLFKLLACSYKQAQTWLNLCLLHFTQPHQCVKLFSWCRSISHLRWDVIVFSLKCGLASVLCLLNNKSAMILILSPEALLQSFCYCLSEWSHKFL